MKAFIEKHPDYPTLKDYFTFSKAHAMCLVGFLVFFFVSKAIIFAFSCTTIHVQTFLMASQMAKGKKYSLAIPHLALLYKALGEFCGVYGKVKSHMDPGLSC